MEKRLMVVFCVLVFALAIGVFIGCGSSDDDDSSSDDAADDDGDDDAADDDAASDDDAADDDAAGVIQGGWEWLPVAGAMCRDGSATGMMIRKSEGSDKLLVFMQGGGACYSEDTCADNPAFFGEAEAIAESGELNTGILNNGLSANPVGDWNVAFIPYCTGDVYSGDDPDGAVSGVGAVAYVGYNNMKSYAAELTDQFPSVARVLLSGESAGGFGSYLNYKTVADAFAPTRVDLFDDSGPFPAADNVLAPCYQLMLVFQFGAYTLIDDVCPDCIGVSGDGFSDFGVNYATNYPNAAFGFFSYLQDEEIRSFFGGGYDDCAGIDLIPADEFAAGLIDWRDNTLAPTGRWGTFFTTGETHTGSRDDAIFFDDVTGGKTVAQWLTDLLNDTITQVEP